MNRPVRRAAAGTGEQDAATPPSRPAPELRALVTLVALAAVLLLGPTATPLPAQVPEQDQPGETEEVTGARVTVERDFISISVDENEGMPLPEFIKMAETVTGRVIHFSTIDIPLDPASNPDQKVTFVGTMRIRRANFFSFFQTILYMKNFACVIRGSDDTEIVEIVNMQGPKRPEVQSSSRYVDPAEIDDYATQTGVSILTSVPLRYVNANTAQNSLRPFFVGGGSGSANVLLGTVGDGRSMVMQGFGPQVYAAFKLLQLVDVEPEKEELEMRVVALEHASAEELQPVVKDILDDRTRRLGQQSQGGGGDVAAGPPPTEMQIVAHPPQNALVLSGTRDQIVAAQDLVARLDVPLQPATGDYQTIRLQNVLAEDLRETLQDFLERDAQADQAAQGGQQGAGRTPRRTVVVAHEESNSLLISGSSTKFSQIRRMIEELDIRQDQVLIEAALVELSTTDLTRIGIELGFLDIAEGDFTRPFGFTSFGMTTFEDTDDNGLPDTRLPDFENPLRGVTGGIISSDDFAVPVIINALANDERANILTMPSVVVNNTEEATVTSKEVRPTQTTTQNANTTQTGAGDEREAGIELQISPSISENDYLRINISLEVSRFLSPFDPSSVTAGRSTTRTITSVVTMPSGHTMVFGGVIEDSEVHSDEGVPLLKDIPLLGYLFRTQSSEKTKTNLYFFLTPTILDEEDFSDLAEVSWRTKMEASRFIGERRMQILDRKWRKGQPRTLADPGTTIEDLDDLGGFELPFYRRPGANVDGATNDGKTPRPNGPQRPGDGEGR